MTNTIQFPDFTRLDLRAGTILDASPFPEAKTPAYLLRIDFGPDLGILKSSARITQNYSLQDLPGRQVLAVVNLPPKQIGPHISECLVTGFPKEDGSIILATPEQPVPNGARLC
ncbi:MAG TPA: tRNA-binding protein [Planctomycetes bacterium]|nr:tRNA-binding protein [Planctomycetota bacterium]